MEKENIDHLLLEYFAGELSVSGCLEMENWLEQNQENRIYFEQFRQNYLKMRWGVRGQLIAGDYTDIKKRLVSSRLRICFQVAAVAVCLLCVGGVLWYGGRIQPDRVAANGTESPDIHPGSKQATLILSSGQVLKMDTVSGELREQNGTSIRIDDKGILTYNTGGGDVVAEEVYNRMIVPRGGEFGVTLEDGSKVWLNAESELRYPVCFIGKTRTVYLSGEAYFEVKRDAGRPFIVNVDEAQVKVYGTRFNVNNRVAGKVETVLVEGSVGITGRGEEVRLAPDQKALYDKASGTITVEKVDVTSYVAWKEGNFVFSNEPLENIMDKLVLWYDFEVFYASERVRGIRLSGDMMRYKNVEDLFYYFERIADVKFSVKGRTVVVK